MSAALDIPAGERGRIRVFAVNLPPEDLRKELAAAPKADVARRLLGTPHLDTRSAELFPVSDLQGVGLAGYLAEGYAVPETELSSDRQKLDSLEGFVLLLFSDSFGGAAARLLPGAEVTLIGTYAEALPDNRQRPTITPSAAPYSGVMVTEPPVAPRGSAGRTLLVIALATAAGLLLWWASR